MTGNVPAAQSRPDQDQKNYPEKGLILLVKF